jgi:hypothetical protein
LCGRDASEWSRMVERNTRINPMRALRLVYYGNSRCRLLKSTIPAEPKQAPLTKTQAGALRISGPYNPVKDEKIKDTVKQLLSSYSKRRKNQCLGGRSYN